MGQRTAVSLDGGLLPCWIEDFCHISRRANKDNCYLLLLQTEHQCQSGVQTMTQAVMGSRLPCHASCLPHGGRGAAGTVAHAAAFRSSVGSSAVRHSWQSASPQLSQLSLAPHKSRVQTSRFPTSRTHRGPVCEASSPGEEASSPGEEVPAAPAVRKVPKAATSASKSAASRAARQQRAARTASSAAAPPLKLDSDLVGLGAALIAAGAAIWGEQEST